MKKLDIQVLGTGCPTCKTLHQSVITVAHEIDPTLVVSYSDDITKIVALWVMSSPVFAINGKVITAGRLPTKDDIKKAIVEKGEWNIEPIKQTPSKWGCSCGGRC